MVDYQWHSSSRGQLPEWNKSLVVQWLSFKSQVLSAKAKGVFVQESHSFDLNSDWTLIWNFLMKEFAEIPL